jgi:hypothetical protein
MAPQGLLDGSSSTLATSLTFLFLREVPPTLKAAFCPKIYPSLTLTCEKPLIVANEQPLAA